MDFPPDLLCWFLCNCCGCGGLHLLSCAALSPAHILTITLGWLKSQMCAKKLQQRSCSWGYQANSQTHLSPWAWRIPGEYVCLETGPWGPPGDIKHNSLFALYFRKLLIYKTMASFACSLGSLWDIFQSSLLFVLLLVLSSLAVPPLITSCKK